MINDNCGVYLITSPSNGRYVGSSKSLKKRFNRYKNYSCSRQSAILASLKKYGYESHKVKVLMYCEEQDLYFWERVFGDMYLALAEYPNGLNLTLPGYDDVPQVRSEEFRKRVSEIQKKRFEDPEERKRISVSSKKAMQGADPERRNRIGEFQRKRLKDPEKLEAYKEQRKAYYRDNPEAKKRMSEVAKNAQKNPEIKKKSKDALDRYYAANPNVRSERMQKRIKENPNSFIEQGKKMKELYKNNPELRKKLSEKMKLQQANSENRLLPKKVINIENGQTFPSVRKLAKYLQAPRKKVADWLNGVTENPTPYRYA